MAPRTAATCAAALLAALAIAPATLRAQPAAPDGATACRALDPAAFARIGIRVPTASPRRIEPRADALGGVSARRELAGKVRSSGCVLAASDTEPPRLSLTVLTAADRASLAALAEELHGGAPAPGEPKPVEEIDLAGGYCMIDRTPAQPPGRPPVPAQSWDQACSVVRGQRIVQLSYSSKDRRDLARLSDFRALFDSIAARF